MPRQCTTNQCCYKWINNLSMSITFNLTLINPFIKYNQIKKIEKKKTTVLELRVFKWKNVLVDIYCKNCTEIVRLYNLWLQKKVEFFKENNG
jgi:hypothetical protein